jgi:hypothetical protein
VSTGHEAGPPQASGPSCGSPDAVIESAEVGPSHDGTAEAVLGVRYPNGALRHVAVGPELLAPVLEQRGLEDLAGLVGLPWSVLVEVAAH